MNNSFEIGPIRPPSEAYSILLRITRNCPWNRCAFCSTYRDQKFSRRTVDEIKADIDGMHSIALRLSEASVQQGLDGRVSEEVLTEARADDPTPESYYRQVAFWMQYGMRTAFLQDANSLIMNTQDLVEILRHLKARFPFIERVTSYARAKTVSKKSPEELSELRAAGLTRLHIGMESGCDGVLELISKGVTAEEHILAGRKAMDAGFDLSEYYMPGLGGESFSRENALESARVLSAINPTFIRLRSTVPLPGTPLADIMAAGEWVPLSEDGKVREIRLFVENLGDITSTIKSDHMMNLLEDVEGSMPAGRGRILSVIDRYLGMSADDRESFIIGRRLGLYRLLSDFGRDGQVEAVKRELKSRFGSVDAAVMELLKNYI
ncbi:MAG TPA: radical SAM protein [Spirochaetota bacterium]|nr:radical SAM protein [Spirochaetota bacterium]HNU90300.1 radical SAM protein [Spirochaetota bacterium]HPV96423.1 radical SAM protein [Spirochaetota bacterium]